MILNEKDEPKIFALKKIISFQGYSVFRFLVATTPKRVLNQQEYTLTMVLD
jgi:hypothetical protein